MTDLRGRCQFPLVLCARLVLLAPLACAADVMDALNAVRDGGLRRPAPAACRRCARARCSMRWRTACRRAPTCAPPAVRRLPCGELFLRQHLARPAERRRERDRGAAVLRADQQPGVPRVRQLAPGRGRVARARRALQAAGAARPGRGQPAGAGAHQPARARVRAAAGRRRSPPRTPLTLNATLSHVARLYAQDMAAFGYMDHTGHDGSSPAERITRSGYRWREMGENLASGIMTPEELVAGWLESPDHCANLMDPLYPRNGRGLRGEYPPRRGGVLGDGVRHAATLMAPARSPRPQTLLRSCVCSSVRIVRRPGTAARTRRGRVSGRRPACGRSGRCAANVSVAWTLPMRSAAAATSSSTGRAAERAAPALRGRRQRSRQAPVPEREHGQAERGAQVLQHVAQRAGVGTYGHRRAQQRDPAHHPAILVRERVPQQVRPHAEQDRQRCRGPFLPAR